MVKKPKKYMYARINPKGEKKGYGWHTIKSAKEYRKKGWTFKSKY